jgi:hypothetical protein
MDLTKMNDQEFKEFLNFIEEMTNRTLDEIEGNQELLVEHLISSLEAYRFLQKDIEAQYLEDLKNQ